MTKLGSEPGFGKGGVERNKQLTLKFFVGASNQIIKDMESPLFPGLANGPGLLQQICQDLLKKLGWVTFLGTKAKLRLSLRIAQGHH